LNPFQKEHFDAAIQTKPFLRLLTDRLLSIGGELVVCWNDDFTNSEGFVKLLLEFGKTLDGSKAILKELEMSRCHQNSIRLAIKHPKKYERHIGYGLSDSLWRPHSFLVNRKTGKILETTVLREKYFSIPVPIMDSERMEL
jgi:hypothetical protein